MSKVIFVFPKTGFDIPKVSIDVPLSVLSVASNLNECDVEITDQRLEKNWKSRLKKEFEEDVLCVAVSSMTGVQIKHGLEISKFIKENFNSLVIWGGIHPTLLPEQTLSNQNIDAVVIGEGELIFNELVDRLNNEKGLKGVRGVFYKKGGKIIKNRPRAFADINRLPRVDYKLLEMEKYVRSRCMVGEKSLRVLPFVSSRGCVHRCKFCCNPEIYGSWRALNADETVSRVVDLFEQYNLDGITFHDENFFSNAKRVEDIAKGIKNRFEWFTQGRVDELLRLELNELSDSGLRLVQIGAESGSDRILKMIGKNTTTDDIIKLNSLLSDTEIVPVYNFMVGFPTETENELDKTIELAIRLLEDNSNALLAGFYIFSPYPATGLFDLAVKNGFEAPKSLEEWSSHGRQNLSAPWIKNREIVKRLVFSSKFVDGKRMNSLFRNIPLTGLPFCLISRIYRKGWENKNLKPAIPLLSKLLLR